MDFLKTLSNEDNQEKQNNVTRPGDDSRTEGEGLVGKLGDMLGGRHEGKPGQTVANERQEQHHGGGGGIGGMISGALGGGEKAEAKEDPLDKAIDFVQQHILHEGAQDKENVVEQMKDESIAATIRSQYKQMTGKEFPIKNT